MSKTKQLGTQEDAYADNINTKYVYELAQKNEVRGNIFDERGRPVPEKEYKPRVNVLLQSAVVLGKGNEFDRQPGKYLIEYYDGCTTLFSDQHPKDPREMDSLRKQTRDVILTNGRLAIYGYDILLKKYLDICSWNGASPYRVPTAAAVFVPVDSETAADREEQDLDLIEKALLLAKSASEKKLRVHGRFLGVSEVDVNTGNPSTIKQMRAEYRRTAMKNPKEFIKTYNDKSIELSTWISKALEVGEISTTIIPNQAVWKSKGAPICDVSGIQSKEGILNKLIEFAKSDAGADFNDQLSALYN